MIEDIEPEELAAQLYDRYCESVGGEAYNGTPLPTWEDFRGDESKLTQSEAWVDVAIEALVILQDYGILD